jgi:hypothetical protein
MERKAMKRTLLVALGLSVVLAAAHAAPPTRTPKEALQAFQDLIGPWKGTGTPYGSRESRDKGFWQETIAWKWQFKGADVSLRADVTNGKHFTRLELRFLPATDAYQLKAWTPEKETLTFEGKLDDRRLTVDRLDPKSKQTHRLVFSLLHSNRYLYRFDVKPADHTTFTRLYQVGVTKQGVAFASENKGPECIVSGGLGKMPVTHKGKTYYVCCSGCRDAFLEEPDKYIKEYEEAKKKK